MADVTAQSPAGKQPASLRTVVAASAAGTTFEWYDFFVFGSLTQVISRTFFSDLPEAAGYVAALALFGAGFLFRPLGALVFGRIGDRVGRKGAFLVTVTLMGSATVAIGLLPTYAQVGLLAPALLVAVLLVARLAASARAPAGAGTRTRSHFRSRWPIRCIGKQASAEGRHRHRLMRALRCRSPAARGLLAVLSVPPPSHARGKNNRCRALWWLLAVLSVPPPYAAQEISPGSRHCRAGSG